MINSMHIEHFNIFSHLSSSHCTLVLSGSQRDVKQISPIQGQTAETRRLSHLSFLQRQVQAFEKYVRQDWESGSTILLPKFEVLSLYHIKSQACSNYLHSQCSASKLGAGARSAGMRSSKQPRRAVRLQSVREGPHSDLHMHTTEHTCTHTYISHTHTHNICTETLENIWGEGKRQKDTQGARKLQLGHSVYFRSLLFQYLCSLACLPACLQ